MAIAYVGRAAHASGATSVNSFSSGNLGSAIAAGDLIVVSVSCSNVGDTNNLSSVTDTQGNTYVSGGFTVDGGQNTLAAVWYCANCKALGTTDSVTAHLSSALLTSGESWEIAVDDVSGAATSSVTDGEQGKNSQVGATWNTGTGITTTNAADLLWVAMGVNQGEPSAIVQGDCAPTSGWTIQSGVFAGASTGNYLRTAYQVMSATGTYSGGGTAATGNNGVSAVIVAFKAAAGGGSTPVTLTDSGTGSDSLSITATVPLSDGGTGADTVASLSATVPLTDSGAGADALAVAASMSLADSGTGADSLNVAVTLSLADAGTGADALSAFPATFILTDAGAGADTLSITASFALADSGTGADSLTLGNPVALADAGSGAETFMLAPIVLTLADSGAGSESALSFAPIIFTLTDTGGGIDVLIVAGAVSGSAVAVVTLSDSAVGLVTPTAGLPTAIVAHT